MIDDSSFWTLRDADRPARTPQGGGFPRIVSEDGYLVNGSSKGNAHSEHSASSCDPAWEAIALPAAQTVPKARRARSETLERAFSFQCRAEIPTLCVS